MNTLFLHTFKAYNVTQVIFFLLIVYAPYGRPSSTCPEICKLDRQLLLNLLPLEVCSHMVMVYKDLRCQIRGVGVI